MILIFVLFLKLSILHISVSEQGYQCTTDNSIDKPQIFLIRDRFINDHDLAKNFQLFHYLSLKDQLINDQLLKYQLLNDPLMIYQEQLIEEFYDLCKNYYNINIVAPGVPDHHNVIHFAVPDYYKGKPLKNFVYAGNISKIDDAVCTKTGKDKPKFDCKEIVNLVSEPVLELHDGHIYDFVQKMSITESGDRKSCEPFFPKTSDLSLVLLCLREPSYSNKQVNIRPLHLIQLPESECNQYLNEMGLSPNKNRLLAMLAPEPFKVPSEYSVPIVFYETPYLFSEDRTAFPNSINLAPWRLLKYGFLKFIQTVGWQRVAIVSDDSEYSLDFEDELTALFSEQLIMYTVIRCEDANCDMDKIAQELSRVSARIVIANVEGKHAEYLFQKAHNKITWLVRGDMVENRLNQNLANYRVAFSFSLSIETYNKRCNDVEDNILTGLSSIAQAYNNIAKKDYKVKKREFYRHFAGVAKQVTPRITEATIVVRKLYSLQEVSTMYVNATGVAKIIFSDPFKSGTPTDGTAECLVTSYDYHKPCEDPLVMFLMLTLMLFMLTFITITCFFDKTSPFNDIRYQNF